MNEVARLSVIKVDESQYDVNEAKAKANAKSSDWQYVGADWKDIEGLIGDFRQALPKLGVYVYDDPMQKGSDTYGFILSKVKLSKEQIKAKLQEEGMWPEDDD